MSGDANSTETANPPQPNTPIAQFWADWLSRSNEQTRVLLEVMQPAADAQEVQRRWLDALSQSLDAFMRTPAFQEVMQRNLKTVIDFKTLQDQFLQDCAHRAGVPTAADITGLFERLNSVERAILSRLIVLDERLKNLEAKFL